FRFDKPVSIPNIDVYGFCTPAFGDFTGNGVQDLVCGNFLHDLFFYKRKEKSSIPVPAFENGVPVLDAEGVPIKMKGVINYVISHDFAGKGNADLLVGSENGHVTFLENLGETSSEGIPKFDRGYELLQEHAPLKADVLAVPALGTLFGNNNKPDMIAGTAGGFFHLIEDAFASQPRSHDVIQTIPRILPPDPRRGSIQGPSEIGWGYTCPSLIDWDGDGLLDLVFSDINGEHSICINNGTFTSPSFGNPVKLIDASTGKPLVTAWRVKPAIVRSPGGDLLYYCLDTSGQLMQYKKTDAFSLACQGPVPNSAGGPVAFTSLHGGSLGRDKLQFFEWSENGRWDLIVAMPRNHDFDIFPDHHRVPRFPYATIAILCNRGTIEHPILDTPAYLVHKELKTPLAFGHHSCAAEAALIDGKIKLIVGGEDGQFYRFDRDEFT
nr:hypothetical protein [Candidatus Sigynarchaeota archaeon]